jgi:hypothetical protein
MLMYSGNDSNTTGTDFIMNRKYKQAIMNFEAVDERICSLRLEGKFHNFTIISVHASMEEKEELFKDCFYNKLNHTHQRIPAHDTKIIVGDFQAKIGKEEVFRPVIGNCSLHETSYENGIRETDFATNNNMMIKSTYFPHINIHKESWQSPDRTNNQMDHILADGRNESSIIDVRSCRGQTVT